jgi:hypothetical protein
MLYLVDLQFYKCLVFNISPNQICKTQYRHFHIYNMKNNAIESISYNDIIKNNKYTEYCGTLKLEKDNDFSNKYYLFVDELNIGKEEEQTKQRNSCQNTHYNTFIWHTHPIRANYYPSAEDILKILKNREINYSIIFTDKGIWILNFNQYIPQLKQKIYDIKQKKMYDNQVFNQQIFQLYYNALQRSGDYLYELDKNNIEGNISINTYINQISTYIKIYNQQFFPDIKETFMIKFIKWDEKDELTIN